jgi:PAS domain S-box-containing protein
VSRAAAHAFRTVHPLIGRALDEALRLIWPEPFATEAISRFRHTLATGEPYHSPSTVERRADLGATEAYDWRIERIRLPSGQHGVACYFYDLTERERLQRQLQSRERELSDLANAMPQLVWATLPDGTPSFYSHGWVTYTGRSIEELMSPDGWVPVVHPADLESLRGAWSRALKTGERYEIEFRMRRHDGAFRWFLVRASAQKDEQGVIYRWIGTCTDIEDAHANRNEMQRAASLLQAATDASQLGIHEYDIVTGQIKWDERVRSLWGAGPAEVITYERFIAGVEPEDRAAVEAAVHAALQPSGSGKYVAEFRVRNSNDQRVQWVVATGQVTFRDGIPVRLVGTVQEITSRKLRELRLASIADLQEALGREQSTTGLLSAACRWLHQYLGLSHCMVLEVDAATEHARVLHEYPSSAPWSEAGEPLRALHTDRARALLLHGTPVRVDDVWATECNHSALENEQIRAVATAPYVVDGRCQLLITVARAEKHAWSDQDIELLEDVANRLYPRLEWSRSAEALRQSEANLRRAQAIGRIGTMELDLDSGRASYSSGYLVLHGLPAGQAGETREQWLARIHPEDRDRADRELDDALTGVTPQYASEYRVIWPTDRSVHWILSRGELESASVEGAGRRLRVTQYEVTAQRAAEQAWRDSEARFRSIQDTSIDGFMILTAVRSEQGPVEDLRWDYVNEAGARIVGQPAAWFLGRRLLQEMPGNREVGLFRGYVRVIETGEPWTTEFTYKHEGLDLYLRLVAAKVGDGIAVTFADLTERRRAELRVQASEDRLKIALEVTRAGVFEWNLETDEIHWSALHYALLGLAPDAERPSYALWRKHVHPDDLARVEDALRTAVKTMTPYEAEYRICGADGVERVVQGKAVVSAYPGEHRRMVGAIVDVTDMRAAEAEARANERRFRVMADGVPALIWVADNAGRTDFVNRAYCDYFNVNVEAVQQGAWMTEYHAEDSARYNAMFADALVRRVGFRVRARVRHASGDWRWLESTAVPRTSERGEFMGLVGLSFDVTALVEAEAQQREADRRKDEFLATLSHELRNPLAPVRNAAKLLTSPLVKPDQVQWAQQVIERQVNHMALLLDDLLDMSRVTQGKLELKREALRFTTVVEAAVEAASPLVDRKAHRLVVDLPASDVWLDADPVRLAQILTNLLTNAAKYTDPGGTITLEGRVDGDQLEVSVRDTGVGLSADAITRIFTMFTQVDASLSRAEGGLGIGLALVKGLVELHGGSVLATSDGLGRGATFAFRLPLSDAGSPKGPLAGAGARNRDAAKLRVMVVDDNRDAADTLALMLALEGYDVRTAYAGRDAINLAATYRPDVALLDIGMPGMSGYEVADAIRQAPWGNDIRLVALTGWGQEGDRRRAARAGFDHHLTKPVDTGRLSEFLTRRLG